MHVYCAVYLLDSQGLDGGGLLTHQEAQPLETGLMNTHYLSIHLSVYIRLKARAENTPCCMTGLAHPLRTWERVPTARLRRERSQACRKRRGT